MNFIVNIGLHNYLNRKIKIRITFSLYFFNIFRPFNKHLDTFWINFECIQKLIGTRICLESLKISHS
jgi:hypothetical protein